MISGGGSLDYTSQLQSPAGSDQRDVSPMADLNSSLESSGLSADEASTSAAAHSVASSCETMMWEGWASQPGSTGDDASTSALQLPELAASSTSRLSFHQQSDMLSNMLSHFHPLAHHGDSDDPSPGFLHEGDFQSPAESEATVTSYGGNSAKNVYLSGIPCPLPRREDLSQFLYSKTSAMPPLQMWQSLGPESPSSPLALNHNGSRHSQGDGSHVAQVPWPGATSSATVQLLQDAAAEHDQDAHALQAAQTSKKLELFSFSNSAVADRHQFHGDHSSRILVPAAHNVHSEIHLHNNFSSMQQPSSWTSSPEAVYSRESGRACSARSQQFMNFVRIAQEQRPVDHSDPGYGDCSEGKAVGLKGSERGRSTGKHRQLPVAEESNCQPPKRPHLQTVDHGAALWRNAHGHRSVYSPSSASQAMEMFAIGPALNTNGKPRARRGSATDPQSVYARHRREKINERLKILQHLVPNGAKVDIVTMLDEAVHYVQFLQLQVKLLKSDKYWIHATPNTYKGIDLTNPPTQIQGLGSSA